MSFPQPYVPLASSVAHHLVQWEVPHVVRVSFHRKPVNALSEALWRETQRIFDHLHSDGDVRAVVLSGEGRCFTAGLDLFDANLGEIMEAGSDVARKAFLMRQHVQDFQAAISSIEKCEKPVIGAAHSISIGGAIDILCACDVRYCSTDVVFSIKEVDVGLAADLGTLQRFPKIVGNDSRSRELAFTARNFDAKEAQEIGFVSKIVDGGQKGVVAEAIKTAALIATKSPVAVRSTKALMVYSRDHSVEEGLRYTSIWNAAMLQSEDLLAAMAAAMQKTTATFAKL
ncbi:ClpP/crotonase [Tilletiaria anomala UBC 951]|uniref:ClpP/crotonase n=1 Tax=Tilletiaria anomala (strain ATCC 24038 / CBS 436.72 / UBC 951) TaxID=1037660 RepID=A0A066WP48_TILAU|nr:ClpP/crotonase [Tilletiaria anomala UBC 951]KDN52794.1 ClpP/crotonase [Tilletiaria anomala UBC 951]